MGIDYELEIFNLRLYMKNPFRELINLIYPNLCLICNESLMSSEKQICLSCIQQIPRTNFHLMVDNPVEKKFWGKVPIFRGTSFYFFQKGSPFQKLLHELKYKDNHDIGIVMGQHAALDLIQAADFKTVEIIIPLPLHPKKQILRGYNQSELISKGLATIMEVPVDTTTLIRTKENSTQTKKSVFERFENTQGIFDVVDSQTLESKHVLLVDDVLTTGSTLEAAIAALMKIPNIKISIFTLAIA